jgi:phage shock protein A
MAQIEESIERYLAAMDTADRTQSEFAEAKAGRLKDKIAKLKQQMQDLRAMEQQLQEALYKNTTPPSHFTSYTTFDHSSRRSRSLHFVERICDDTGRRKVLCQLSAPRSGICHVQDLS